MINKKTTAVLPKFLRSGRSEFSEKFIHFFRGAGLFLGEKKLTKNEKMKETFVSKEHPNVEIALFWRINLLRSQERM